MSEHIEYCLGFVFDNAFQSVVLTLKERGLHIGCWNGLGGKIEKDELPTESMEREYREESNDHEINDWSFVCLLEGKDWSVHVFTAIDMDCVDTFSAEDVVEQGMTGTAQVLLEGLEALPLAPHVHLLIAGSIQKLRDSDTKPFVIREVYSAKV